MDSSRRAVLRSAVGIGGIAAATIVTATATDATAATGTGPTGWIDVTQAPYNAPVNTTDDSQPAIQAAVDAAGQGGTVYFPPGQYRLATPVTLSLGVTLRSDWAPHFPVRTNMVGAYLRPGYGNFTGSALIVIDPAPVEGSYTDSAKGGGPRLYGLSLWGDNNTPDATGGAIDGVYVAPGVKDLGMDKVTVWEFSGNGVNAQNAAAFQFNQVATVDNDGHGFVWGDSQASGGGMVDADLIQCYAQGNAGNGYDILNPNAVTMVDCRSEWNAGHGYNITGINYSMVMVGCNTDRNGSDGFHLATASGGRFIQLIGCLAKRDGKATTTASSGFSITGASAEGVVLTGCSTSTGRDDDNGGSFSPAYGITASTLNTASVISVVGGEYVGTAAPFNDTAAALVRHSGVTAGIETGSGITWDKSDVHMLNGAAGTNRDLQFWTRGKGERWALRATDTAESGTATGSNFALARYDNGGTVIDTPIVVKRDTGKITLGQSGTTGGNVEINVNSNPGLSLNQAFAAGQGYAITGADTSSRAFQASVSGDSINRLVIDINGTQAFGPGGSTGRDTTWGRGGAAQIGSADSDIVVGKVGKGLRVAEGTNARMGTFTLAGSTGYTVATTAVTANSRIFLTIQAPGGTPGGIAYVSGRTAGTSFTVKGASGDSSTVAWLIVEPA
jgi:hypothetical protein